MPLFEYLSIHCATCTLQSNVWTHWNCTELNWDREPKPLTCSVLIKLLKVGESELLKQKELTEELVNVKKYQTDLFSAMILCKQVHKHIDITKYILLIQAYVYIHIPS